MPRDVDKSLGEFWLENPFDFEHFRDVNLSMYERNRVFWSRGGGRFDEVSAVSGADIDSDSRACAVGDLDEDGRPDLLVRNVGGGPLRVYLNRFPGGRGLTVTLRGTKSNRDGIGARLVLEVGGRKIHRDHFPQNSRIAQNANETIFGFGDSEGPGVLTVTWPSGIVQTVKDARPGRLELVEPGE